MNKGKAREIPEERPKTDMEREWEAANGFLYQMAYSKIARALPTRPDIKELQYSGARFSRGAIARLGQQLQSRYPTHKFQILLPYENWKPEMPHRLQGSIKKPEYIKKALGLNRDAPVPVSYMDKVEQLAGSLALNIVGDSTRISKSKSDRRATLILSEGHYSLALNPGRLHPSKLDRKQKSPFVYREDGVNNVVTIYNGKTVKSLTVGQFQKGKNSDSYSFIPIEKNCKTGIYETLEETYQRIHEERDSFLQATKKFGLGIDLSYHNWSYKRTALWLFERFSVGVPANDPLDPVEAEWISDAMMGGLIWADNEWKGYGRQYDVTSLYPSIQQSNANFPIRQGKFQILKDFVDHRGYALYGLFRASSQGAPKGKVSGNDILFRQNKRGVYTFIDLQRAKKLGLDIQLIQDGKPNALIYDREARIPGTVIFGEYVHFLFNIKNQGGVAGRVAKRVLNTLWGALCQRKRNYKTLTTDQTDPFKFPEGHTLDSIVPVGSDQWRFQFTNPGSPFKGEYPRIAPFLLAHGRKTTSELLEPYKDKVRRIHTDGFILEEQPSSPTLITCPENASKALKALKFETAGYCHVKNANKVIWT
ncbi:hypothetical protein GLOIN_2v1472929 [Rhizophagus irregularis DAOM 181602=DAOM 197198]|nr:hypothetical protein GLOIN_2v1472929 [Rhizophagus irregularis DAOM 181602=DAOM 197198]